MPPYLPGKSGLHHQGAGRSRYRRRYPNRFRLRAMIIDIGGSPLSHSVASSHPLPCVSVVTSDAAIQNMYAENTALPSESVPPKRLKYIGSALHLEEN
jgi:hypothetical protein